MAAAARANPDYDELAARLAEAAADAQTPLEVAAKLQERAEGDPGEDPIGAFMLAFNYHPINSRSREQRQLHGAFGPIVEWDGRQFPPPLGAVEDATLKTWAEVADRVQAPLVRSRLNDLLWERKFGDRPDQRARSAVEAYLEMRSSTEPMVAPEALVRALEISRALGDTERTSEIAALIVEHAASSVTTDEWDPGAALVLVEALIDLPAAERPDGLADVLEQAKARYADDPFIVESVLDLQVALGRGEAEQERELRAEAVARFRQAAAEASGIVRVAHLQHALEIARASGLREEMEEMRRELQGIQPEELDLKEIRAEVSLPTERLEELISNVAAGDGWPDCLERFVGLYGPPSGPHEKNVELIKQLKKRSPLLFMITSVQLGPEGTVLRELRTEEEHVEAALTQHEREAIAIWGQIAAIALARIQERHGEPNEDELSGFFETALITAEIAKHFAHGVAMFAAGRYDDAAHVLSPRLEGAIREVCRQIGLVVAKEPIGLDPGGVRPLGQLLASLKGILDESWRRYLVNTLTEPLGMNLRNRISHGLIGEAQAHDAALLIHSAVFLRTLQLQEREPRESVAPL